MQNLTKEKILELRDKYLGKEKTGWILDEETGAIIVYALEAIYSEGNYYSMKDGTSIGNGNYVKTIRNYVGSMPLQIPGTGVVVYRKNCEDKLEILLQLRVDCDKYGLPGGGIELGESYEECAVNELEQETALIANKKDLVMFNVYAAGPKHITKYPNGDIVYHTVVVYTLDYNKCKKAKHKVDIEETKELEWMTSQKIQEILDANEVFPNNVPILEDIVQKFLRRAI